MPQIRFTKAPSVPRDKVNEFAKYVINSVPGEPCWRIALVPADRVLS